MKLVLVEIFLLFFLLLLGGGFVAFRAAVYDGQYLATWSPLAKDDASFPQHLKRKGDVLINNYQYLRIRIE